MTTKQNPNVGAGETANKAATRRRKPPAKQPVAVLEIQPEQSLVPYDENLLERARTQWQFGDWQSLAQLDRDTLQHHPDRAKLALLAAAGRLQTDNSAEARQFVRLAQDWGCSNKLIAQILIANAHNALGRVAAVAGQQTRALKHFESSIKIGMPGVDVRLLTQARIGEQLNQLRLPASVKVGAGETAGSAFAVRVQPGLNQLPDDIHQAWLTGQWAQLAILDNAELPTQPNRAELAAYAAVGYQQIDDADGLQRCSRLALEWGCPKPKLKALLAAGIRNTLAITETLAGQYETAAKNFIAALRLDHATPKPQAIKTRIRRQLKNLKGIDVEKTFDAIVQHIK